MLSRGRSDDASQRKPASSIAPTSREIDGVVDYGRSRSFTGLRRRRTFLDATIYHFGHRCALGSLVSAPQFGATGRQVGVIVCGFEPEHSSPSGISSCDKNIREFFRRSRRRSQLFFISNSSLIRGCEHGHAHAVTGKE